MLDIDVRLANSPVVLDMRRQPAPFPWVIVIVGLVLGFVVLGAAGLWVGFLLGERQNANFQVPQGAFNTGPAWLTPADAPVGPPPAFGDPEPPSADQKESLDRFFARLTDSLADPEADVWRYFDFDRMYEELVRVGAFRAFGTKADPSKSWFVEGARLGLPARLRKSGEAALWTSADVRRVSVADGGEVAVYAVVKAKGGPRTLMRFCFTEQLEGNWRLYDWEDLEVGLHTTYVLGAELVSSGSSDSIAKLKTLANLPKALQAVRKHDHVRASDLLDACNPASVPPFDEPFDLVAADYELQLTQPNEVGRRIDGLIERNPNLPRAYLLRAKLAMRDKEYEVASEHAERYLRYFDADAEALTFLAEVREKQGRPDDARPLFLKALADSPGDLEALDGFRRTLPGDRKAEFLTQFLKAPKPHDLYETVVAFAHGDQDRATVELLAGWLHKDRPTDVRAIKDLIGLRAHAGKPAEAITLYKAGLKAVEDEEDWEALRTAFLHALSLKDLHLEGYAAVPDDDARFAFDYLAYDLDDRALDLDEDDAEDRARAKAARELLDRLIAAHRKRVPADPWPNYFDGQQRMRAKEYAAADKVFAAGLAALGKADLETEDFLDKYDSLRSARTEALYRLKQGLTAHRDLSPKRDTFDQLARLHQEDGDAAGLRKLIDAHRAADARDALLDYWTAQVHWEAKEYEPAVRLLRRYADTVRDEDDRYFRYSWRVTDQVVRGLVRLKRPGEAKDYLGDGAPPILRVVVLAANQEHEPAVALMVELAEKSPWMVQVFYTDPDLGPHIAADDYEPFREKFAPPSPKAK
jgi:hypothetical protein